MYYFVVPKGFYDRSHGNQVKCYFCAKNWRVDRDGCTS